MAKDDFIRRCSSTGKIKYKTAKDAQFAAKSFRKRVGSRMNAYICNKPPTCGKWHIGHDRYKSFKRIGRKQSMIE